MKRISASPIGSYIHEGEISAALGCLGIPSSAEEVMVARDIILAEETGASPRSARQHFRLTRSH